MLLFISGGNYYRYLLFIVDVYLLCFTSMNAEENKIKECANQAPDSKNQ